MKLSGEFEFVVMTLEIILVTEAPHFSPPGALQTSVCQQRPGAEQWQEGKVEAQDSPSAGHSHSSERLCKYKAEFPVPTDS